MTSDFPIGCTYNFLQPGEDIPPLERFAQVRDTGAFDYMHWLPPAALLADCVAASEKTGLPMLTGNVIHRLGHNDERLTGCMADAAQAGNFVERADEAIETLQLTLVVFAIPSVNVLPQ